MTVPGPARTAALDQHLASVTELVDEYVSDVQAVLQPGSSGEVLLAVSEWLGDVSPECVRDLAAGCLLRLAQGGER